MDETRRGKLVPVALHADGFNQNGIGFQWFQAGAMSQFSFPFGGFFSAMRLLTYNELKGLVNSHE